ncbi:FliM/FliN family flagellar motor switch protein [Ensifer sp. SL37]|uniref:FliM/FliN family flagellar motor switch protein n=1 Tax=Ensifer sp. SL37 TaxID=2995137 RepID=UPI0022738B6D|nr:FliM/FliN family flagellar motor switch protein [Ensifer sp. SL37]MCY1740501.1 FliM/FliN family flagellar motor switch protein [Ensifer sp. SL37]
MLERASIISLRPEIAAAMNSLCAATWNVPLHHGSIAEEISDPYAGLSLAWGGAVDTSALQIEIRCSGSFGQLAMAVERRFLDTLSDVFLPGWRTEDPEIFLAPWRATLVVSQWAKELGVDTEIDTISVLQSNEQIQWASAPTTLAGRAFVEDTNCNLALDLVGLASQARLTPLPALSRYRRRTIDPGFICNLGLPSRIVLASRYQALAIGDVILLAPMLDNTISATARIPGVATFSAHIGPQGELTLADAITERREPTMNESDAEYSMSDGNILDNEQLFGHTLEELPVKLDFLLASQRVTLGELRELDAGSTVDLRLDLNAPVVITANGLRMGCGHLVQLGDHVGVQITQWPGSKAVQDG